MYIDSLALKLRDDFEGLIPWFYLDGPGNVTIGVGCMIPAVQDARKLPMLSGTSAASPDAITKDFLRVKALKPNCGPKFYCCADKLMMSEADCMALLHERLAEADKALKAYFKDFDAFPDAAKCALLDMVYNLGARKLEEQYVIFNGAVKRRDWKMAAAQCYRNGPNGERNQWTRLQFLSCA